MEVNVMKIMHGNSIYETDTVSIKPYFTWWSLVLRMDNREKIISLPYTTYKDEEYVRNTYLKPLIEKGFLEL